MYNDNEMRSGAGFNGEAPSSENPDNMQGGPENKQPADNRQQTLYTMQSGTGQPVSNPYYEPWQQSVSRETKAPVNEPYSPGIHNGAYNAYQKYQPVKPQPEKKSRSAFGGFVKAVCLVLVCLIAGGGAAYGVVQYKLNDFVNSNQVVLGGDDLQDSSAPFQSSDASEDAENSAAAGVPDATANVTSNGSEMSAEDIYAMAVNQVVGVNSEAKTNVFGAATNAAVSGSGFVISSDGYIVTNYHVISYAAEQGFSLTVMMHDGTSYPAKIIGYESDNDLAVIKIDATGLSAASLGSNDNMKVGEEVYAIGNPLGELDYTMTSGIVSALDRLIQVDETTSINMFQMDAAVNQGNSGGPVYNSKGEVIGIVSAKYASTGVEGLGFAIPIDDARDIVEQLMTSGHVSGKPSMGISVKTVTQQDARYYNIVVGAYVVTVDQGSSAEKAGLKVGDIIIRLGDTEVTSADTLKMAKKNYKAGETATMVVNRDGEELTLTIVFDEEGVMATASEIAPRTVTPQTNT
jgi:serine protease Do